MSTLLIEVSDTVLQRLKQEFPRTRSITYALRLQLYEICAQYFGYTGSIYEFGRDCNVSCIDTDIVVNYARYREYHILFKNVLNLEPKY